MQRIKPIGRKSVRETLLAFPLLEKSHAVEDKNSGEWPYAAWREACWWTGSVRRAGAWPFVAAQHFDIVSNLQTLQCKRESSQGGKERRILATALLPVLLV